MAELKSEIGGLRAEFKSEIGGLRSLLEAENRDMRQKMDTQFYWVLTFILGSILIPILRDLAVVR